jgi:hypothetical protein
MSNPRFALRLLAYGDAMGVREELIGDVLEELDRGRSNLWVYQQVIGLFGFAFIARLRSRARLTPHVVALGLCALLFAGASIAPAGRVLEAWLLFDYVAGTLSLFAHMVMHTEGTEGTENTGNTGNTQDTEGG